MLKYSVRFSIKNNEKDDPTPLRLRVSFNSMRIELYPRIIIKPSQWDDKKKRIKGNAVLNNKVAKLENIIIKIFDEYELIHKRYPEKEELKEEFAQRTLRTTKKKSELFFHELIEKYIEEKSEQKQWTYNTLIGYIRLKNIIIRFDDRLVVENITESTLRELFNYFIDGPKTKDGKRKDSFRNTTLKRTMIDYMRILKWGKKNGYYHGNAHEKFEQDYKGTKEKLSELVYLEWKELMELYNYDFSDTHHLEKVRDVFCFCCFTSLRFSDVKNLKKSDIKSNKIHITTKKTSAPIVIELNNFAKEILKKYDDLEGEFALPVFSMVKTNIFLKEIGQILNFNTPVKEIYFVGSKRHEYTHLKKDVLSTHAARKTFVVNAIKLGIPLEVIIKWTGHRDFESLKPYVKIVDELKEKEMEKFNNIPTHPPKKNET